MKTGDQIHFVMFSGRLPITLTLDEFVPFDPSCYHYDAGFWAFDADEKEYFVSAESGTVYAQAENQPSGHLDAWDVPVGTVATRVN